MRGSLLTTARGLIVATATMAVLAICSSLCIAQSTRRSRSKTAPAQPQLSAKANVEFEQFAKLADEARLSERIDDAISLYGKALKIKPQWPDGWWYIGAILYREGSSTPRLAMHFRISLRLSPSRGQAWANA